MSTTAVPVPPVLATLIGRLAADVAGYSRLMEREEAGTLDRLKAHRKELAEPLVAEHRVLLYPSHRGGWEPPGDFGAVAMPLDLALEHLSANPYFLELRQTYC